MHYCSYLGQPLPSKACKILNLDVSGDLTIIPSLHITFVCATPPTGLSAKTDFLGNTQSGQISFEVAFSLLRLEKLPHCHSKGTFLSESTDVFVLRDHPFKTSPNFHKFGPLPPYRWQFFSTICRQICQIFDPSPLRHADVLNRWSLTPNRQMFFSPETENLNFGDF